MVHNVVQKKIVAYDCPTIGNKSGHAARDQLKGLDVVCYQCTRVRKYDQPRLPPLLKPELFLIIVPPSNVSSKADECMVGVVSPS